jgi:hypothetical protein
MRRDFTAESESVTSGQEFRSREREEGYRSEEGLALIPPCQDAMVTDINTGEEEEGGAGAQI